MQALRAAEPADDIDRITVADLGSELELELESHDARLHLRDLNVIASPAQEIREVFDLMPTGSRDDWERIATRLGDVPRAIDGYIDTLRAGAAEGVVPAVRQVREVAAQAHRIARPDGFFGTFAANAKAGDDELAEPLRRELERAAADAASAYGTLAEFLEGELQPVAGERDAVGRDIYALRSRHFLGAVIDLDETYEWGIEELARMVAEQESIANEIVPGASVAEAIAFLDGDPARKLHGTDALQRWMQETSDRAVAELGETQFDIPAEIRTLECMIAPTQEGGIYYTGPSDDFTRPGRMWWSVPRASPSSTRGASSRPSTTRAFRDITCRSARPSSTGASSTPGGASSPARRGTPRAGRSMPSGSWRGSATSTTRPTASACSTDSACARPASCSTSACTSASSDPTARARGRGSTRSSSSVANVNMNEGFVRFEVNRYLGWPGQAPSYKVGQRIWEQLRDEVARREGAAFDIREFHRRALDLGGVGLDTLRGALLA